MKMNIKIKGVTFQDRQPFFEEIKAGQKVFLMPQLNNEFDEYATMIVDTEGRDLGYVPKENSKEISELIKAGKNMTAVITDVVGGGDYTWGARVEITIEDE
jgi:hypothetical protein